MGCLLIKRECCLDKRLFVLLLWQLVSDLSVTGWSANSFVDEWKLCLWRWKASTFLRTWTQRRLTSLRCRWRTVAASTSTTVRSPTSFISMPASTSSFRVHPTSLHRPTTYCESSPSRWPTAGNDVLHLPPPAHPHSGKRALSNDHILLFVADIESLILHSA